MASKASKKVRYVLLPSEGMAVASANTHQMQLFQSLHTAGASTSGAHTLRTETGTMSVTVIDSIGENKAKLIEVAPEDLPAFRGAHPRGFGSWPLVYYQRAVVRHQALAAPAPRAGAKKKAAGKKKAGRAATRLAATASVAAGSMAIKVTSAKDKKPVAGAFVVAFTDFRRPHRRAGHHQCAGPGQPRAGRHDEKGGAGLHLPEARLLAGPAGGRDAQDREHADGAAHRQPAMSTACARSTPAAPCSPARA